MLVLSVLTHWALLGGLELGLWSADDKSPAPTSIRITLDNAQPPAIIEPRPTPTIPDHTPEPENPITPETVTPPQPVIAETDQPPTITRPIPRPEEQTGPTNIDPTQLRRQVLASIRQPNASQTETPTTTNLPGNWTQDALPTGVEQPTLLEPLTYTGPVTTERWKSADGTPETRKVLADGTVLCAKGLTLLPNSNFEANIMQTRICGKEKGGRENRNRLARFHPSNDEQDSQNTDEG